MLRKRSCCLLAMLVSMMAISGAWGRIVIEPNPNGEVGMMSSGAKFFNCKSDQRGGECQSL